MQFLASPVSLALHINGRLVEALGLQVFGLLLRTGAVILALALPNEPLSEAYALSGFVFYLIYILLIVRTTGARIADLMQPALQALPIVLAWILLGLFAAATLTQIKGLIV
jgi:hypothetical protein